MEDWEKGFREKYYYSKMIDGEWLPRYDMSKELMQDIKDFIRREILKARQEELDIAWGRLCYDLAENFDAEEWNNDGWKDKTDNILRQFVHKRLSELSKLEKEKK